MSACPVGEGTFSANRILLAAQTAAGSDRNPGLAILIIGMLLVIAVAGPLFVAARAHQRRYFRAYEQVYGVTIHDPHVWEMRVEDTLRRNDLYWKAMLNQPDDPMLDALRRQVLAFGVAGVGTLVIGFLVVYFIAAAVGFE